MRFCEYIGWSYEGMPQGVPIKSIPLLPEDQGDHANEASALLTWPKNVNVGIFQQVTFEWWRDISAGQLRVVANLEFDVKVSDEYGLVKSTRIGLAA